MQPGRSALMATCRRRVGEKEVLREEKTERRGAVMVPTEGFEPPSTENVTVALPLS
jgi:hypothetical protein